MPLNTFDFLRIGSRIKLKILKDFASPTSNENGDSHAAPYSPVPCPDGAVDYSATA